MYGRVVSGEVLNCVSVVGCSCITPGMVLCCCDPRSTGKKSAEKYMVGLRKDAKGNYVIDDITDYERDAAGGAADIF